MKLRSLDDIDRSLTAMLQANASEATAALARRPDQSRCPVQGRIRRSALHHRPQTHPAVGREIRKTPEAEASYLVSGAFDLIIMVAADSAARRHEVLQSFGTLRGVERTTSSIVPVNEFENR